MNGTTELSPDRMTPSSGWHSQMLESQILERVKPDRVTVTKPEEDRRRRTIIVEKKNGSYGFTLQSYGIHYKKEQEIEMITYVDHVDYDGPAFRAGMREGDVILSINGRDMEKVDHKNLVNFIKSCDTRMRMVVLFEDCVRKVELHMRYIRLQNALKSKTLELEKLCIKEKELLSGKWKTHSLPARKKNSSTVKASEYGSKVPTDDEEERLKRSTVSTEDVGQAQNHQHVQHRHLLIAYPRHPPYYIDSHGRAYYLHPSRAVTPSSSKEYLVSSNWSSRQQLDSSHNSNHCRKDSQRRRSSHVTDETKLMSSRESLPQGYYGSGAHHGAQKPFKHYVNDSSLKKEVHKIMRSKSYHQHICGGCLRGERNDKLGSESTENGSLEAYDLAGSPACCSAECVPTRRRRSHSHHAQKMKPSSSKSSLQSSTSKEHSESHSNRSTQVNISSAFHGGDGGATSNSFLRKHAKFEGARKPELPYQSLVSQHSLHSCISSELPASAATAGERSVASYTTSLSSDTLYWDQPSSLQSARKHSAKSSCGRRHGADNVKPVKSWDDLASGDKLRAACYEYADRDGKSYSTKNVSQPSTHDRYFGAAQSSESLFYSQNLSEASFSCEYLDQTNPTFISNEEGRFVPLMPSNLTSQRDKASQTDSTKRLVDVAQTPEVTRL